MAPFYLRTLGPARLLDPHGRPVELTDTELAVLTMVRLLKLSGLPKKEHRAAIGEKLKQHSEDPRALADTHLSRIAKKLPVEIRRGGVVRWIEELPCDLDALREASRSAAPGGRHLLHTYRPFLEGLRTGPHSGGFERFVREKRRECDRLARLAWSAEVDRARSERDGPALVELGRIGLAIDESWEEAYLVLHQGCCGCDPPCLRESLAQGERLLEVLAGSGRQPSGATTQAIAAARQLLLDSVSRAVPAPSPPDDAPNAVPGPTIPGAGNPREADDDAGRDERLDIFLAVPMEAYGDDYPAARAQMLAFLEDLRQLPGASRVYYAGEHLETSADYDDEGVALRTCLAHLRRARFFMMIYPERLPSSVLFEAGLAVMLEIPGVIFYREWENLPFLLRGVGGAFPDMRTCRVTRTANLLTLVKSEVLPRLSAG